MSEKNKGRIINWIGIIATLSMLALAVHSFKDGNDANALMNLATACVTALATAWNNNGPKDPQNNQEQETYEVATDNSKPSPEEQGVDPVGNPVKRKITPETLRFNGARKLRPLET